MAGLGFPYVEFASSAKMVAQELEMSCGFACARQLLVDRNVEVLEGDLRRAGGFVVEFGAEAKNVADALTHYDAGSTYVGGTIDADSEEDMLRRLAPRVPWIARLRPMAGGTRHFVIVDAVGDDLVHIRDPWGPDGVGKGKQGAKGVMRRDQFISYWRGGIFQVIVRTG